MTSPIQLYKQAYSGLSRNSWYLCLVMLVNRSGTMVVPFMTIYCIHQLHFTIVQAGYIMAIFGLGAICGAFAGGKVSDKIGFYDLQIFALLSGGVLFIVLGFMQTFAGVAIGSFVLSFCNESFRPANSSAIAYYSSNENRTRSYSLNRLAVNLGWAFGGILASINYHLLFWVDGCTNIVAAFLLLRLIPRSGIVKIVKEKLETGLASSSAYKDKIYLLFIALTILFASCFFQIFTTQPLFYKSIWEFNERTIGFLMAANGGLIVIIEMVMIHKLEGRRHPLKFICVGVILTGIGFALANVLPGLFWSGIIIVIFLTIGEMLSMPFMNTFWINRTSANNRGEYAGLYTMAWSTAQVLAPTIGTRIINHFGFYTLWWVVLAGCLLASAGFLLLYKLIFSANNVKAM